MRRPVFEGRAIGRQRIIVLAVCLVTFAALTVLVHLRALYAVDLAFTRAVQVFASEPLDGVSTVFNVLFSAELSTIIGVAGTIYLWRHGFRAWSLVPVAFMPLVALEFVLKTVIQQPPVPPELHRYTYYPLVSIQLAGSFPSGHAIRTTFFCLLGALLARSQRSTWASLAALCLLLLIAVGVFTRVYLGHHWLSDVVGGALLGGAVAQLLAPGLKARGISKHQKHRGIDSQAE